MPTLVSSAQASAAAKHCRVEGMAKGLCGLCETVEANHLRLSTAQSCMRGLWVRGADELHLGCGGDLREIRFAVQPPAFVL